MSDRELMTSEKAATPDWRLTIMMLVGGIMIGITMVALTPVLPLIETDLARTDNDRLMVKLLVTVTGLTMVFGAPLTGFLLDRVGVRPVMFCAAMLFAVAGAAGLFLSSLPLLLISRLFVGLAASGIATTSMTLINTHLSREGRAKWMGMHVAVATIGSLILHPVAGGLGEFGWRWPFLMYLAGLPLAVLALSLRSEARRPAPRDEVRREVPTSRQRLWDWFPFRFLPLAVIIGSVTYLPMVYLPFLIRDAGVSSPLIISLVGLGDAIMASVMALMFVRARRRFSSQKLFVFSFGCAAIGVSVAAFVGTLPAIVIGMTIYGLGLGWFVPNLMTAAADCVGHEQQGRTVGLVKGAHYIAAPACVMVVEPFARQFGPQAGMLAAAGLALFLVLMFLTRIAGSGSQAREAPTPVGPA